MRDEDSVRAAAAHVGGLDLVVCNAGTLNARGGLTDPGHTPENIAESLMTNIAGVFFTARHFAGHLKGSAAPRIAICSCSGCTCSLQRVTCSFVTFKFVSLSLVTFCFCAPPCPLPSGRR